MLQNRQHCKFGKFSHLIFSCKITRVSSCKNKTILNILFWFDWLNCIFADKNSRKLNSHISWNDFFSWKFKYNTYETYVNILPVERAPICLYTCHISLQQLQVNIDKHLYLGYKLWHHHIHNCILRNRKKLSKLENICANSFWTQKRNKRMERCFNIEQFFNYL